MQNGIFTYLHLWGKIILPSQNGKVKMMYQLEAKKEFDSLASDIIISSDTLVKQLGEQAIKIPRTL